MGACAVFACLEALLAELCCVSVFVAFKTLCDRWWRWWARCPVTVVCEQCYVGFDVSEVVFVDGDFDCVGVDAGVRVEWCGPCESVDVVYGEFVCFLDVLCDFFVWDVG